MIDRFKSCLRACLMRPLQAVGLLLMTFACLASPMPPGGEIRVGMVNAQTGPASALGQGMAAGAHAVFASVNAAGGVHGRRLVLHVADDGYEPEQTVSETLRLVQEHDVLTLLGYVGTPTVNAILPLLAELDVPLVGVFSGAQSLRQPVLPQVFNVRASYDEETEALVQRLLADGARSVAVVYQNDGFGIAVLSGTQRALKRRGVALHASASFQRNTVALRMALSTMVERQPDAIVLVGPYEPVATFAREAQALGLKSRLATVSFVGTDSLLERLHGAGEDMLISQVVPFPGDQRLGLVRRCSEALMEHSGQRLGYVSLEGCISAWVLVRGLELAGPQPNRKALMRSMESLRGLDLGGLGVNLSAADHQALHRVFLTRVQRGQLAEVP